MSIYPTPKKPLKNPRMYFNQETEDAIVKYNNTPDPKERSKIYEDCIHYAFFKLTENIIHTFKFYNTVVENLEDLQHEVILFLLSKIHRFDPSLGYKAYSYFSLIAKRYLIIEDGKNYKDKLKSVPITNINTNDDEQTYSLSPQEQEDFYNQIEDLDYEDKEIKKGEFIDKYVEYCIKNINVLFSDEGDQKIALTILDLFKRRENIVLFNKKALYLNIREQVDVKAPKITKVSKKLYKIYKEANSFYVENDYYKFEDPHIYNKI